MELFVGLDVSVRTTSVCVMDASGKLIRESEVESEPAVIADLLHTVGGLYKRVGLEAGPGNWAWCNAFFDSRVRSETLIVEGMPEGCSSFGTGQRK